MSRFQTANPKHIQHLYHWQRYIPDRLVAALRDRRIWFSQPSAFNDPWDCKPSYNTDILRNADESERHIQWYGRITRERIPELLDTEIERRQQFFRDNQDAFIERTVQLSASMWSAIDQRYRVYCLGPDVLNTLMWSHYADSHKGICLEFSTKNKVVCCALRVEYSKEYPLLRMYSDDPDENLVPLLTKSDAWSYEKEYRLVAQEHIVATEHDTLKTNGNFLELPPGAITAIIVGCQGPYEDVRRLVQEYTPDIPVRRAERIPNQYALQIR